MTFLSVYTPTHKRPKLLAQCIASVQAQTVPVQQLLVHDEEGIGIAGVYAAIPEHTDKVHGEYVMVLSDDNVLAYPEFAADLQTWVKENDGPDVVVFKGRIGSSVQPAVWQAEPQETKIDLSCFAVRRELWVENADKWGKRYAGDFDFIHHLWVSGARFSWWDRFGFRALQISNGRVEQSPSSSREVKP